MSITDIERFYFGFPNKKLDLPQATNIRFTRCGISDLGGFGDMNHITKLVCHEVDDNVFSSIAKLNYNRLGSWNIMRKADLA